MPIKIYQTIKAYTPAPNRRNRRADNFSESLTIEPNVTRIERGRVAEMRKPHGNQC